MKFLKKITFTVIGITLLLISVAIGIAWYFEGHAKQIIIEELNQRLNQDKARLEIEDINLSLLKKFPYASLDFKNSILKINSASSHAKKESFADTLFNFEHIYLEFNIRDLFEKKYAIKAIELSKGKIYYHIDEKGNDNTDIWNIPTDSASSNFRFLLKKLLLKECKLQYSNLNKKQYAEAEIRKLFLKGNFSNDQFDVSTHISAVINNFYDNQVCYATNKEIEADVHLIKNNHQYEIQKGQLSIEKQLLTIEGAIHDKTRNKANIASYELNVKIYANNLVIEELLDLLPSLYREKLHDYKSKGVLSILAVINGTYSNTESPETVISFEVNHGEFIYKPTDVSMTHIFLKGEYSNGNLKSNQSNGIKISEFKAQLGNGDIAGKCSIKNLSDPSTSLSLNGKLSLADWQRFVPVDSIESMSGDAAFNIALSGRFNDSIKLSSLDLNSFKSSGNIDIKEFSLHRKNKKIQFDHCQLALVLAENELLIDNLEGKIVSSDIKLSGLIQNILPHIINKSKYTITAIVQSDYINLNELLSTNEGYALSFPENARFALQLNANKLEFRKFSANKISAQLVMDNRQLQIHNLSLQAFEGNIQASGTIETKEDNQLLLSCNAAIDKINIQTLFYQCEEFNQTHIESKNMKGIATAKVHLSSMWNNNLTIQPNKIYSTIDLTIEKGELINVETLQKLSGFISMDELLDVHFSTLHNVIEIKNKAVYIPEMEIHSSALDISLSGVQTFDNEIEYHFKILLSELLAQKFRKNKKKRDNQEYFGEVEDDGSGKASLYLTMTKTVDDPKISFDKKFVLKKVNTDLKAEGKNLKTIIKEENSWRNTNDTAAKANKVKSSGLLFNWDEKDGSENSNEMMEDTTAQLSRTQQKRRQAFEEFRENVFKK